MKYTESPYDRIRKEIGKTIVGQDEVVDLLMITALARGHAILEGVPGLAKTLLVNSLAKCLDLSFNRVQFTPDMVPSDITGTEIIDVSRGGEKEFRFVKGPVFANIVLADEINRTPPKTQSALLQAMQERQVTILGKTHDLPDPFLVFATQNPIEYEGTYPLPEAQLDRFLLHIPVLYPDRDEELRIIDADPSGVSEIRPVVKKGELSEMSREAGEIPMADRVKGYVVDVVRETRPGESADAKVRKYVRWGAGPRAAQMLVRAAKAHALLRGKKMADKEDVDFVLPHVLRHRVILDYHSVPDGVGREDVIASARNVVEKSL